ncbi:hypothetical protein [Burkholderia diffusa]|uniref:hypothetical protein n=1 Tax=Burkholderia diffusa TaxID=488732 RepID=UPI002AAF368D|nr:hypothetical protein [Burkholderia diffusa]
MTKNAYEDISRFLAIAFISFGTGVFWVFLVSELIRHVFDFNEDETLIYFGGPFLLIYFFLVLALTFSNFFAGWGAVRNYREADRHLCGQEAGGSAKKCE